MEKFPLKYYIVKNCVFETFLDSERSGGSYDFKNYVYIFFFGDTLLYTSFCPKVSSSNSIDQKFVVVH